MNLSEQLSQGAADYEQVERDLEAAEALVSELKRRRERILLDITEAMKNLGFTEVKTLAGPVAIKAHWNVQVADKGALADWLENNGMASIIKTEFRFGKGEDTSSIQKTADLLGIEYELDETVHPQTLKKAMREWVEGGNLPPPDSIAKVTVFERAEFSKKEAK